MSAAQRLRGSLVLGLGVVTLPLMAACIVLPVQAPPRPPSVESRPVSTFLSVAQVRHGHASDFELCRGDACPRPTPKTRISDTLQPVQPLPAAPIAPGAAPPAQAAALSAQRAADTPPDGNALATAQRTTVVTFGTGSAQLTTAAKRQLEVLIPDAQHAPTLELRGRTDALGSLKLNDALAHRRAWAVHDYLRARQLPTTSTIQVSAQGACCYIADNATSGGRAANRRVEIEYRPRLQLAHAMAPDRN